MTILEFTQKVNRNRIGVLGSIPGHAKEALQRRGYSCYLFGLDAMPDDIALSTTDCLILVQEPSSPMQLELIASIRALNSDCRIYIKQSTDSGSISLLERTIAKLTPVRDTSVASPAWRFDASCFERKNDPFFAPYVYPFIAESPEAWEDFATLICRNPAGAAPRADLKITGCDHIDLSVEQKVLLARAFHDCREVRLIEKSNGLSGIATYEALAYWEADAAGSQWPGRFFVKLGNRDKVSVEYTKYLMMAMENVPFHLGPRLRIDRCCLGVSDGLIVSDYVSGAEALRDCARAGRGTLAIANLFNETLWAWRRGAKEEETSLGSVLQRRLDCTQPTHRRERYSELGATCALEDLKSRFNACTSTPVLTGTVHGDLHATNVLVRHGDAVIIDLEKVSNGQPLLFDFASLEGGLLVDGFIKGDDRPVREVLESIKELYERSAFLEDDHFCELHSPSAWYFDSVRQIRMQARQLERGGTDGYQYAWTLAAVLIRKSCNAQDFTQLPGAKPAEAARREEIRAMAYVVAELILNALAPIEASGAEVSV